MLNSSLNSYESGQSYKKGRIRFVLLFSIVFVAFGNQYAFNNPQALQESLYEHLNITQTQFQLFYSLYSLPNVFTLIFVGYYLDKFGMRIGFIILSLGLVIFQLLFAIGGALQDYKLMLAARVLFGIASRSLFIPQAAIISFWFKGNQLSFALGIGITFPQLGNALNSFLTPIIYEQTKTLGPPLFVSVGICCLGFIGTLVACYIDKKAEKLDLQNDIKTEISEYELDTTESKH